MSALASWPWPWLVLVSLLEAWPRCIGFCRTVAGGFFHPTSLSLLRWVREPHAWNFGCWGHWWNWEDKVHSRLVNLTRWWRYMPLIAPWFALDCLYEYDVRLDSHLGSPVDSHAGFHLFYTQLTPPVNPVELLSSRYFRARGITPWMTRSFPGWEGHGPPRDTPQWSRS